MLDTIFELLAHWSHGLAFVAAIWYGARPHWRKLGATEKRVLEAMKLPQGDLKRDQEAFAIDKEQRKAIFALRICLLFAVGILWLLAKN